MSDVYLTPPSGDDATVVAGNLMVPRSGLWTADLLLGDDATPPAVGEVVTLTAYDRARVGYVAEVGDEYLQLRVRVVAGRGLLGATVRAQNYRGYSLADVARDVLRDCGEAVGDLSGLTLSPPTWVRQAGAARSALRRVLRAQGSESLTRLLAEPDGSLSVVPWVPAPLAELEGSLTPLAVWPQDRTADVGPDLTTKYEPGQIVSVFGRELTILRVLYDLGNDLRARFWYA